MSKKCFGCGEILQSSDENKNGYILASKINDKDAICKRCFRLKHYGENKVLSSDEFESHKKEVEKIKAFSDLILLVAEPYDIATTVNYFNLKNAILVVNKMDVMPKNFDDIFFKEQIKKNTDFIDYVFISSLKNTGINKLVRIIYDYAKQKKISKVNVAMIGFSNVGKSALFKSIAQSFGKTTKNVISPNIGTTLKKIEQKLEKKDIVINLIDTPGVVDNKSLPNIYPQKLLKNLKITKKEQFINLALKPNEILMLTKDVYIESVDQKPILMQILKSSLVNHHKTSIKNFTKIMESNLVNIEKLDTKSKTIGLELKNKQINISGFCIISIKHIAKIKLTVSDMTQVYVEDISIRNKK